MIAGRLTQQGDLQLQGNLNTRLPLVTDGLIAHFPMDGTTNSATTHFVAKAQNYPYETEDGIWDEYENIQLFNSGRSWHISVWDMYTNDWAVGTNFQGASEVSGAHARYDVYALTTQIDSFVNTINSLNNTAGRYMVAITGGHAAEANFSSSAPMKSAIKLCGGTTSNLSWTDRRTYICVGEVGCGEGNAQIEKLGSVGDVTLVVPFFCYSKAAIDSNTTKTNEYVAIEEGTTNLIPNSNNRTFSAGNGHGTYNVNNYNRNNYFNIGTVVSVVDNIVTLNPVGTTIRTYDVLNANSSGGGVTAYTSYFIKKHSSNSFSLHAYNSTQDGSQGYYNEDSKGFQVHYNVDKDIRIPITASGFPTLWKGNAHLPNSGLVKEIRWGLEYNNKIYNYIRCHTEHRKLESSPVDFMAYGVYPVVTAGTGYSYGFMARAASPEAVGASINLTLHTSSGWGGSVKNPLTSEWQWFSGSSIAPNSGGTNLYFNVNKPYVAVDIGLLHFEQKDFSTSFVDGTRDTSGGLQYPVTLNSESTISFDYFCKERISNTVISNSNFNYWWGLYLNSAGILYTHTGHNGGSHMSNYTMPLNQWVHITIKWTATVQSYYADGVLLGTIGTVGSSNAANIPVLSLGIGWNVGNALFKNVSIYNRALSDGEIKKLIKGTHSITSQGLITKGIDIKPSMPDNANYFPFDLDGKDYHKSINPTKDVNTAYVDGSVWIGSGTTNAVINQFGWGGDGSPTVSTRDSTVKFRLSDVTRFRAGTSSNCYLNGTDLSSSISSTSWTFTTYMKRSDGGVINSVGSYMYVSNNTNINTTVVPEHIGDGWYKATRTRTGLVSGVCTLVGWFGIDNTIDWFFAEPQVEQGNISTPFVDGSRSESSLHLPYNVIDCKQDFTIYGWWYPKVLDGSSVYRPCLTRNLPDTNDTGNRILVMNGSSSSSTKLFCWFGSGGSESSFGFTSKNILLNEWNFFALRRVGNDVLLSHGNSEGIMHAVNSTASRLNTDEVGQVWQVGEYSNSESNAYHKDYVFYQGSMTDAEIEAVFKTKMQATKDGLAIQNSIRTNEIII